MFRLLLWQKGKGSRRRNMSDVNRLGVHQKNTDSLALYQMGKVSGNVCRARPAASPPPAPSPAGRGTLSCSDQLKVFPPLLGETSGIC